MTSTDVVAETVHGTYAQYERERKVGETCEVCRKARADYSRKIRKENPAVLDRMHRRQEWRRRALMELARRHPEELDEIMRTIGPPTDLD
jgi:hypothetical protein